MSDKLVKCKNCGFPCVHISIPAIQDSREEEDRGLCCNCLKSTVIGIEQCAQCEHNQRRIIIRTKGDVKRIPNKFIIRFCCEQVTKDAYLSKGDLPKNADVFFTVWFIGQTSRLEMPYEIIACKGTSLRTMRAVTKNFNISEEAMKSG